MDMGTWPHDNTGRTFPIEILTTDEVRRLISACGRGATGIRNRALIALLYRGGLRCSEALDLMPHNVDMDRGAIEVLHGKGNKRRVVAVDPGALSLIERWTEVRGREATRRGWRPSRHTLICRLDGDHLTSNNVRQMMRRLAERAGIEKRVHPHGLRHTMAAELAGEGIDLRMISAQLGHASIATTDRYVRHLMPDELVRTMQARAW